MRLKSYHIEVCFTPETFQFRSLKSNALVVVTDVFRASTTICTAMSRGIKKVIPVLTEQEAINLKKKGYKVAAERQGKKLDFADFGNSPTAFPPEFDFEELAITTTNGTKAIQTASGAQQLLIGSFSNIDAIAAYVSNQHSDVMILCSGWNGSFSLEDVVFAGALAAELIQRGNHLEGFDSTRAAIDLWNQAALDLQKYLSSSQHYQRLINLGLENDLQFCLESDTTDVVPILDNHYLTDIKR